MVQVQQPERATSRSKVRTPELTTDTPEEVGSQQAGNQLDELLSQAENAYQLYRQAQQEVARGYKKHEEEMEKLFKYAEKRANDAYEKVLAQATSTREQVKQQAEEACRTAQAEAEQAFQRTTQDARRDQRDSVGKAWRKYVEGRENAWGIFQGTKRIETTSE